MTAIGGIDHVIVLVRDLEAAMAGWRDLGFRPTPLGVHSAHMGTHNATIVFPNRTYIELMGVRLPTPANAAERAMLAVREGLFGFVGKTADAEAAARQFQTAGLGTGEALGFSRPVALPTGNVEARFTVARPANEAAPGAFFFVCQHHTPDAVWRSDYLQQPNGVRGLVEVVGVADDLDALAEGYARLWPGQVQRQDDRVTIGDAGPALTFLTPAALRARFGDAAAMGSAPRPGLAALVLRGVERRRVPATEANGVLLAIEP
ncbi:MAG: VOC family protein [Geminicoccaceae bacterium]|nr:MAG: VOC family protein [Geminicoccaceae bacterium]